MESTIAELIKNLNQTIDFLTKENEKLRTERALQFQPSYRSNFDDELLLRNLANQKPEFQTPLLNNQMLSKNENEAFKNADYIISKSLDLTFLIKKEIIQLLEKMKLNYDSPALLLDAITNFVHKNQRLLSYNYNDKNDLVNEIKNKIYQKLVRK